MLIYHRRFDFRWLESSLLDSLFALLFTTRPSVISPLILYALAISSCAHICRPERERPSCPRNQNIYDIYVWSVCSQALTSESSW
jgi:hypothetical protein